ncbi:hypothetical protein SDC9_121282 [bioreactor metagenome]|uniref:Uncharacterized protein n=1 Tax=bioreactor metagenome TaxID=1076179 RepID=A0A645CBH7_9ZZZZ
MDQAAGQLDGDQALAEHVGQRQPQEVDLVGLEDSHVLADPVTLVRPGPVGEAYALRPAGGAGGVDQRRQGVGAGRGDGGVHAARVVGEPRGAECPEGLPGDDLAAGVEVRHVLRIEDDDLHHRVEGVPVQPDLVDLFGILGEDDPRPGVPEDVRHVLVVGVGVDGGGGAARAHDGKVDQDPLDPRAGRDRDPVLELQSEGEQASGQLEDAVVRLVPAHRGPGVVGATVEVRRAGPELLDRRQEHPAHRVLATGTEGRGRWGQLLEHGVSEVGHLSP